MTSYECSDVSEGLQQIGLI